MNLESYMEQGVRNIAASVSKFYLSVPAGRQFLGEFLSKLPEAAHRRSAFAAQGLHVPTFLIASIVSRCNLHCAGCYARAEGLCKDASETRELTLKEWEAVFSEAESLGIPFILLAGGEPLLRQDVIEAAGKHERIAFPVFTNGTLLKGGLLDYFDQHRNLIPVISIEGTDAQTDARRGSGMAASIAVLMKNLHERRILYAASITVTRENLALVAQEDYLSSLRKNGCGIVFFIEYVPVQKGTEHLVLTPEHLSFLKRQVDCLRLRFPDTTLFSFPGDEVESEGCLAAGRGFFHINPAGGAEPCPFSPFSRENVKDVGLAGALRSAFFAKVRRISASDDRHHGGCTLFLHEEEMRGLD